MIDTLLADQDEQPSKLTEKVQQIGVSQVHSQSIHFVTGLAFLLVAVGPAAAQSDLGSVWCGTGVDTGITIAVGAMAGLGLPWTIFSIVQAGIAYERAGGNPEKRNEAKEKLVKSAVGFAIITLAVLSPAIINNIGSQMGFGFADCMNPF